MRRGGGTDAEAESASDFRRFCMTMLAPRGQRPERHHLALIDALERVTSGEVDRLMVQMPPGAAKSTYASVLFPAFWFTRHPASEVIAACHTASLAGHFGRRLRMLIAEQGDEFGLCLDPTNRAAGRFSLQGGAQYFAAGVRGPITGRRADLILIDDPVKSWAEADSRAARDALYDWYRAELLSRLKPGGRVVLVMTRWHEDDLAGRLMARDGGWTVLRLPALAEADDPLGRAPGEALWPDWEDEREIARRRTTVGERVFAALYQQRPMRDGGSLFELDRIGFVDAAPSMLRAVRAWDLAATAASAGGNPDWTVGLKLGLAADGTHVVLDVVRVRAGPAAVEALLRATAEADGPGTAIALPQDPGQAGVAQVAHLRRVLEGFTVIASPESGSKQTRALPAAARIGAGRTRVLRAAWTDAFVAELRTFPNGEKDDQVDALARAEATLGQAPAAARMTKISMMGR